MEIDATCRYIIEGKIKPKRFRVKTNSIEDLFFPQSCFISERTAELYLAHLLNKSTRLRCQMRVLLITM